MDTPGPDGVRVQIMRDHKEEAQQTAPRRGTKPEKWNLPLDELGPNDVLLLKFPPEVARKKSQPIRAYCARNTKRTGRRFAVFLCDEGIKIWPKEEYEP